METKSTSFLTFMLDGELFAIGVHKVLEIIETGADHSVTNLPKAPDTIEGVVNFRGNVIPIVNSRLKFDMATYGCDDKFVIMVLKLMLNNTEQIVGAMADKVVDVIEIDEKEIQPVPEVGKGLNSDFITGVLHRNNQFITLLDFEKAISSDEIIQLKTEDDTIEVEETETAENL
ncbi:chemotaxis protein CheW [Carboxylicivirga marina]|uniref:Chemotaxis protein CheW n=1 Tax=Carboxylicivirga marina TaxID=2800988 RepID=A0ABS1HH22_9BACT|nr:chemotaxis protein CheW [Carboxylicivirga marina]MBK3516886.1 chemotaxis protein CheW [Carboxylicivirga marina]